MGFVGKLIKKGREFAIEFAADVQENRTARNVGLGGSLGIKTNEIDPTKINMRDTFGGKSRVDVEELTIEQWETAIGDTGWNEYDGLYYPDPNANLTPFKLRGVDCEVGQLTEMVKTDPVLFAGDRATRNVMMQATLTAEAAGGKPNPTDLEKIVADYYQWTIEEMSGGLASMLEYFSTFASMGFAPAESIVSAKETPWGFKFALDGLEARLPQSVSYWVVHNDGPFKGQPAGMAQSDGSWGDSSVIIPMDKLVMPVRDYALNGPEGDPLLRSSIAAWQAKRLVFSADAQVWERFGKGIPIAKQVIEGEVDERKRSALQKALANYVSRAAGYLIPPYGFEIDINFPAHSAPDPSSRISMYNMEMLMPFMALWQLHGTGTTGTQNVTSEHIIAFRKSVEQFVMQIAETLDSEGRPGTGLLPRLARANWNLPANFRFPRFKVGNIRYKDVAQLMAAIGFLMQNGALLPSEELAKWIVDTIGAPTSIVQGIPNAQTA